jgi:hypothetical protein
LYREGRERNKAILEAFAVGRIPEREATFCLIDQRATECGVCQGV